VNWSLYLTRYAAEVIFLLEAQRLIWNLIKPVNDRVLSSAEQHLLSYVSSPIEEVFVPVGGYKMHTLFVGSQKSCRPVVLLHCHSGSAAFFFRNFDDYVRMGYWVIAPDLLGWGRSSHPEFEGDNVDDSLNFFLDALELWRHQLGLESFALVGHSLGAYLAYEFTRRNENCVTQLTLICPAAITKEISFFRAIYFSLTPQRFARRLGGLAYAVFHILFPKSESYSKHSMREYTWMMSAQNGPGSGDCAVGAMIDWSDIFHPEIRRPLIENLEKLRVPVLLIGALFDTSISCHDVEALYEAMCANGTSTELCLMSTDHCPFLEDPETYNRIVRRFNHFSSSEESKLYVMQ